MDALELLRTTPYDFHPGSEGQDWGLAAATLTWLNDLVPLGGSTLETGVGDSTAIFLSRAKHHIAIGPEQREADAVAQFCSEHGILRGEFEFHCGGSEYVLPKLELPRLDLVLIDGQHAFPAPFIDWFYTAEHLSSNGFLIVDDIEIKPCKILVDFLKAEPEWRLHDTNGRAAVFQKVTDGPVTTKWWAEQPWCLVNETPPSWVDVVRDKVRARTRLRNLRQGLGRG